MTETHGAVRERERERERESYTLKNGSKALLEYQNKIMKFKDMIYLFNLGIT